MMVMMRLQSDVVPTARMVHPHTHFHTHTHTHAHAIASTPRASSPSYSAYSSVSYRVIIIVGEVGVGMFSISSPNSYCNRFVYYMNVAEATEHCGIIT
jgi:hypothetical protein